MSNRLFSATGAVWHCGPKHVKRTWRTTACNVLMLLALAALTGWLWSCVRHAAAGGAVLEYRAPKGLAVAPMPMGVMMGFGALALCVWAWSASRKTTRDDEAAQEPAKAGTATPVEDPLALPAVGMTRDELRRIIAAMIAEATEARGLIESEMDGLGVETWEERLARAQRCIHGVVLCLGNLADRCQEPPAEPMDGVTVQIRMDSTAFRDRLEHNKSQIAAFVSMLAVRAQSIRAYHSAAAGYRPNHGGYVA